MSIEEEEEEDGQIVSTQPFGYFKHGIRCHTFVETQARHRCTQTQARHPKTATVAVLGAFGLFELSKNVNT